MKGYLCGGLRPWANSGLGVEFTGLRASLAASILQKAGFREVYSFLGGMSAWKTRGYPLVYERLLEK